jgi:hypothetical protein
LTTTIAAREHDPQPSNNSIGWMANGHTAMDALFLVPGSEANVWFHTSQDVTSVSIESSNSSVISVPGGVTLPAERTSMSFVARAVGLGKADIRIFTPTATIGTLTVDVVAPGTRPRWHGAVNPSPEHQALRFDMETHAHIYTRSTAPFNGERATGDVIIKANGREVGRTTLEGDAELVDVAYRPADIGTNAIEVAYAGDANFLPMTTAWNVEVTRGFVTVTGSADRNGEDLTVNVVVTGSPMAAPSGTITVEEAGVIAAIDASLAETAPGVAQASITLPNAALGPHTFLIRYSGDVRYEPATQNLRITGTRRRTVRH